MKVLLASQAIAGHFNPMTGTGVRLKDEGHEVGWYTGGTLAGKLGELDIPHYPFDRAIEHTADNLPELYPQRAKLKGPMQSGLKANASLRATSPISSRTSGTSRDFSPSTSS